MTVPDAPGVSTAAAQVHDLLDPLRERQRHWQAGDLDDEPEDPESVRAQPLVLRLERDAPPSRAAAVSAAAAASLAVLADPRSDADGEWNGQVRAWLAGRIRKVARRARGAHWSAAEALPGVTVERSGAQVRAFPPYPVAETPKVITRLQVSGTELPGPDEGAEVPGAATFWLPADLPMSAGKAMAQAGHAAMLLAAYLPVPDLGRWLAAGLPVRVRTAEAARWRQVAAGPVDPQERFEATRSIVVRDAGFTEVAPGTITITAHFSEPMSHSGG